MFGSTWGFRGRRIEWRYFRFRQIQDGGSADILQNSNGDISAADRPIYSVFGSRMGFSGSADRMGPRKVKTHHVHATSFPGNARKLKSLKKIVELLNSFALLFAW